MHVYVCMCVFTYLACFISFLYMFKERKNSVISRLLKREYEFEKLERTCQKIYFQLAPSALRTCAEGPGDVIKGVCT